MRIPTGGVLPPGADAVVPIEDVRVEDDRVCIGKPSQPARTSRKEAPTCDAASRCSKPGRRIARRGDRRAGNGGSYRGSGLPPPGQIAVLSSGDELVAAVAAAAARRDPRFESLRRRGLAARDGRGAAPLSDRCVTNADEFEAALASALAECDGVVLTGGSSVGERDRLPEAVARIADARASIVHGLRVKPGKADAASALHGSKPIVGLPGNPASALIILEAVAAPIVAALRRRSAADASTVAARLGAARAQPAGLDVVRSGRPAGMMEGCLSRILWPCARFRLASPPAPTGTSSWTSATTRGRRGALVTVHRFLGGC